MTSNDLKPTISNEYRLKSHVLSELPPGSLTNCPTKSLMYIPDDVTLMSQINISDSVGHLYLQYVNKYNL